MSSKKFSQEQKLAIVKNAVSIGFKEAIEMLSKAVTKTGRFVWAPVVPNGNGG